uniref:Uncharacterized protein n=1 Tax=Arundo donax TaxID=35708 RepID=A0A0A9A3C1_ARUDO
MWLQPCWELNYYYDFLLNASIRSVGSRVGGTNRQKGRERRRRGRC